MTTLIVVSILVAITLLVLAVVGWLYSSRFLEPAPYTLMPEFEVVDAGPGTITVPAPPADPPQFARTRVEGAYNLLWEHGYGRLGPLVGDDGAQVTRELEVTVGRSPEPGDPARIDATVFRRDPWRDHEIRFEDLRLSGEAGELAAWWIPGNDDAVLVLHGRRRADRTEALRILPTLVENGRSVLVLSWRNHDASAPSADGLYRYGATEYRDALTGLEFLAEQGVQRVVVYGFSTGATVGLEASRRWPAEGPELAGMVLDSPLIDLAASVRASGQKLGLPGPVATVLANTALAVATLRTGVRWSRIDQRRTAAEATVPYLVFAGTGDQTIPIQNVDEFVAALPTAVTYVRMEGVEHVEGWNIDPEGYTSAVRTFLAEVVPEN